MQRLFKLITDDLYGQLLPVGMLQVGLAQVVDLDREPGYRPGTKTNGIGLPCSRSDWHRLNDREKALVFRTRANVAVCVPATRITPDQPTALRQPGDAPVSFRIAVR